MTLSFRLSGQRGDCHLDAAATVEGDGVIAGPNGCGKSTLLDGLAGLAPEIDGEITLDGRAIAALPPGERGIGYVFQQDALFPHLTVRRNLAWSLGGRAAADSARVMEAAAAFSVTELLDRRPGTLSGGERQRVAVARAVVARPQLLLLDEPFSALDAAARPLLRDELRQRLAALGIATLLVTHDFAEAVAFGRTICLMDAGRIVEQGPPEALLARPASAFAAALAGHNVFVGQVEQQDAETGLALVRVGAAAVYASLRRPPGAAVTLLVEPDEIVLSRGAAEVSARNRYAGRVEAIWPDGNRLRVRLVGDLALTATVSRGAAQELGLAVGAEAVAFFKVTAVRAV